MIESGNFWKIQSPADAWTRKAMVDDECFLEDMIIYNTHLNKIYGSFPKVALKSQSQKTNNLDDLDDQKALWKYDGKIIKDKKVLGV